jgi:hypothetical protein
MQHYNSGNRKGRWSNVQNRGGVGIIRSESMAVVFDMAHRRVQVEMQRAGVSSVPVAVVGPARL